MICVPLDFLLTAQIRHSGDVLHDDFAGFRFPGSGFPAYHYARVPALLLHLFMDRIGDREDVRRIFEQFSAWKEDSELRQDFKNPKGKSENYFLKEFKSNCVW